MEETFLATLLADGGVAAIVGSRVNWAARPQAEATPAIVLHRITGLRDYHFQGPSGLVSSRIQIDCWAETYSAAKSLARAVVACLSGTVVDSPTEIQGVFVENERDSYDSVNAVDGVADQTLFRTMLDLRVWHAE